MGDRTIGDGRIVAVFGGSGFIGRHVVGSLARDGWRIRIACRNPDHAYYLQPLGRTGQIFAVKSNILDRNAISNALIGVSAVINMVGILSETREQKFDNDQALGAQNVVQVASDAGIRNYVQFSAIGANPAGASAYASG